MKRSTQFPTKTCTRDAFLPFPSNVGTTHWCGIGYCLNVQCAGKNFRSRSSRNVRTAVNYFARMITPSIWLGSTATKGLLKMRRNYGAKDEKTLSNTTASTGRIYCHGRVRTEQTCGFQVRLYLPSRNDRRFLLDGAAQQSGSRKRPDRPSNVIHPRFMYPSMYHRSFTRSWAASAHIIRPSPAFIAPDLNFMLVLAPRFPPMRTATPVAAINGRSRLPNAE